MKKTKPDCATGECAPQGDAKARRQAALAAEKKAKAADHVDRDAFDEPKCFDILLNYACQAKCLFCSQDFEWRKDKNLMPFRTAAETLYKAYKDGYRRMGFTGGEPTLRKDLPQLIALARKVGYGYVRIQTNGIRLAGFDYTKELVDAGLTFVKFSIHGHDAETHDRLTMIPGSFDACLAAIEHLKRLKVGIGVNIVLNQDNYRHLEAFYELFLLKLGLSNFVIIAPLYEGNMTLNVPAMGVRLSEVAPYVRKAYEVFTRINFPKPPLLLHFTPCVLPGYEQQMLGWSAFNTMVVSPQGQHRDLDSTAMDHTVKTEACSKCVYNDRCIGFDASYARYFGTGEIAPLSAVPTRYDAGTRRAAHEGRSVLTDNETCVVEVLRERSGIDTEEFLRLAEKFPICKDCKDENAVINAAETLIKMGLVERRFKKGRYLWALDESKLKAAA
ncbi:MAG: radical SAM protein [Elusimicrobia bacterium]|nr:radical SAM protein [Elusimicrobiota bacterium]